MHSAAGLEGPIEVGERPAVLIVDDHPLYRGGLKAALAPLAVEYGEAATLLGAIDALGARRFELILYDWHLPDGGGCRGLVALRQLAPAVPVVVISADEDEAIAFAAASIGAAACLSKSTDAPGLRAALGKLLGATPGAPAPSHPAARSMAAARALTRRQHDVLQLLARGDSNKRIAAWLGIAETTVRAHVSDLLQLMQARNRTEAVVLAQRAGLISPELLRPDVAPARRAAPPTPR